MPGAPTKFYFVNGPKLWGDYGSILVSGMTGHLPRSDGKLQLERTAPFIPPISLPGLRDFVFTDEAKQAFETARWPYQEINPVIKAHIVDFDWTDWDLDAQCPEEYPKGGEPAGYILNRPHSPTRAEELGEIWEVILVEGAQITSKQLGDVFNYSIDVQSWTGQEIFRPVGRSSRPVVTENGKEWISRIAEDWVSFTEISPLQT